MAFDFKFTGTKEFSKNLRSYKRGTSRRFQDGVTECANAIVNEAQGNLYDNGSIRTGELFDSIVISNRGSRTRGVRWNKQYPTDHPVIGRQRFSGGGRLPSEVSKPRGISHQDAGMHAVVSKPIGALASVTAAHGPFLEFGTIKMAARPFFGPAVDKVRPKMGRLIAKEAKRIKRIEDVKRAAPSMRSITGYTGR